MRDEFARVAIELFAERGFDAVTVDDIAAAAGSSPRTFFRYFATKDDVVLDYERRLKQRLVDALADRPEHENAVVALREAFKQTSQVKPADRARVLQHGRILRAAPDLRARAAGERFADDDALAAAIAARLGAPIDDMQTRVIVAAMTAVATQEFWVWVDTGGRGDPSERIATALSLVEKGLTAAVQGGRQ
jgi:AcrR family transcriptional regulator